MSVRLIALGAALAAAGVSWGLYDAARPLRPAEAAAAAEWRDPPAPIDNRASSAGFLQRFERSGVFFSSPQADIDPGAEAPVDDGFPTILSVAEVDGQTYAYLLSSAGERITAEAGVELEGGWTIVSVSLEEIVAERDAETFTMAVFPRSPS